MSGTRQAEFRRRLRARELLVGTWVKTPSPIIVEVLGRSALDCVCLDAEHAPFDRAALDSCLMAARALDLPCLVRTPTSAPSDILNALDGGATGVQLPHVRSAAEAVAIVRASHYGPGGRGYAGSSRAAGYGTKPMARHRQESAAATCVIAQIEDAEALNEIDAIAATPGLDCLFVGRIDLTVALGAETPDDPRVIEAVARICEAGIRAGTAVGMFVPRPADVGLWRDRGASFFLLGSDHGFLLTGADALAQTVRAPSR